jgi:hypothetical protein
VRTPRVVAVLLAAFLAVSSQAAWAAPQAKSVPLGTPTKVTYGGMTRFTVNAAVGQRLTFGIIAASLISSTSAAPHVTIRILNPQGEPWIQPVLAVPANGKRFYEASRLFEAAGSYTVVLEPQAGTTGTQTIVPNLVADARRKAAPGDHLSLKMTEPGKNLRYTVSATKGQKVIISVDSSALTAGSVGGSRKGAGLRFSLIPPASSKVEPSFHTTFGEITPDVAGPWTVIFDPLVDTVGTAVVTIRLPKVTTGAFTLGKLVSTPVIPGGDIRRYGFTAATGRRVFLDERAIVEGAAQIRLLRPDGTEFWVGYLSYQQFLTTPPLDAAGRWTLELDMTSGRAGRFGFHLWQPTDLTGGTVTTDKQQTVTLGTPGQNARFTFQGLAGRFPVLETKTQTWAYQLEDHQPAQPEIRLYSPDGRSFSSFAWPRPYPNPDHLPTKAFVNPTDGSTGDLPVGGTWTIEFDPQDSAIGSQTFTMRQATTRFTG